MLIENGIKMVRLIRSGQATPNQQIKTDCKKRYMDDMIRESNEIENKKRTKIAKKRY